jgi:hypothetical protein
MLMYRPRFRHPERAAKPVNLTAAEKISAILNFVAAELDDLALDVETPSGEVSAIDSPVLLGLPAQQAGNGHSLTLLRSERAMTECRPISLFSLQTARQLGEEVGAALDKRRFRANVYLELAAMGGFLRTLSLAKKCGSGPGRGVHPRARPTLPNDHARSRHGGGKPGDPQQGRAGP